MKKLIRKLIRNIALLALIFFAGAPPLYAHALYRVNAYYGLRDAGDAFVQYNFLMLFSDIKKQYTFNDLITHDFLGANLDGSGIVHPPVYFSNGATMASSFFFEPEKGSLVFESLDSFSWTGSGTTASHFTSDTRDFQVSGSVLTCGGCGDVAFPLDRLSITRLPEPGTLWLLAAGASLLCLSSRKRHAGAAPGR